MIILVDNREQNPLEFSNPMVEMTSGSALQVGDYGVVYKDGFIPPIFFERKSIGDLYNTLSGGYKRFKKEIAKARDNDVTLILIIEGTLTKINKGYAHSNRNPNEVIQQLFTLWIKYNLLPVFCKDRQEMAEFIIQFYSAVGKKHFKDKRVGA